MHIFTFWVVGVKVAWLRDLWSLSAFDLLFALSLQAIHIFILALECQPRRLPFLLHRVSHCERGQGRWGRSTASNSTCVRVYPISWEWWSTFHIRLRSRYNLPPSESSSVVMSWICPTHIPSAICIQSRVGNFTSVAYATRSWIFWSNCCMWTMSCWGSWPQSDWPRVPG